MDFYEACDVIAQDFYNVEVALGIFLSKHGAILQSEVKEAIFLCLAIAGENKLELSRPDVPDSANQAAGELYKKLQEVEQFLLRQVHSQVII